MGQLTNELAAFPSLHAGWALWVALVVRRNTTNLWLRGLAWLHALITAVVVIGTGNHWILDVAVGWAVVIVAMWLVDPYFLDRREPAAVRVQFNDRVAGAPTEPIERPASDRCPRRRRAPRAGVPTAVRPRPLSQASPAASRLSAWRTRSPSYVVHIGGRLAFRKLP